MAVAIDRMRAFLPTRCVLSSSQAVARQGADSVSVRLGIFTGEPLARLEGFKSRALQASPHTSEERRWHYEIEWSRMMDDVLKASGRFKLLVVGTVPSTLASQVDSTIVESDDLALLANDHRDAVAFTASLRTDACACSTELRLVDTALRLLQSQTLIDNAPPAWLCTMATQPLLHSGVHRHAGLWGLARASRQEHATLPACCVDVCESPQDVAAVTRQQILQMPSGSVRGLHLSRSIEPEAAVCTTTLHVLRLVPPYDAQPLMLDIQLGAVGRLLDAHTSNAMAALDMAQLLSAYTLLETLCQQYLREAIDALHESKVPVWHHRLLYAWCVRQPPPVVAGVALDDVRVAHADLWAEVQLAERCGPHFAEALTSTVAYQELLFPGGSMEAVLPVCAFQPHPTGSPTPSHGQPNPYVS